LVAEETAEDCDVGDRSALPVCGEGVLSVRADREVTAEDRLIDVIRAHFEVVTHRTEVHRPCEVVLELALDLGGRLRSVDALSDRDARGINDGWIGGIW